MKKALVAVTFVFAFLSVSGCTTFRQNQKVEQLQKEVSILKYRLNQLRQEKAQEIDKLQEAKSELAEKLRNELSQYKAKLEMTERGLVLTFLDEIFFDSGQAKIKPEAQGALKKVSRVLTEELPDYLIIVEGHTDNVPIKYSRWHSNWDLASARALAVLHYLVENTDVSPERISAHSYGEYAPVADNTAESGRRENRRVEIVISTQKLKKIREDISRKEEENAKSGS
ncbi:MAG: flagellar motor protein MotB [Candidatus Omnitrophica bacterium]|nr:flagellar motor protein MotB [Candidatus Omnitrophota bacterium]